MSPELNSIARALERLVESQQKSPWDYLYTVTVLLTFCVLVWYTVETCLLRKAGQVQSGETAKLLREAVHQNQVWASLLEEASKLATHLAAQPTLGLGLTKRLLNAALVNDLDAQLELEAALQGAAGRSRDYAEGVAAFLEKRKPVFTGQ